MVILSCEDKVSVNIPLSKCKYIGLLESILPMSNEDSVIPLPTIKATVMTKVIEFLNGHNHEYFILPTEIKEDDDHPEGDDNTPAMEIDTDEYLFEEYLAEVSPWDQKFVESLELPLLIEVTKASNYLNIPKLLDLCCRTIAKQMTGLKAEELRKKFNLPNDFSPEEEARIASEFAWIEE